MQQQAEAAPAAQAPAPQAPTPPEQVPQEEEQQQPAREEPPQAQPPQEQAEPAEPPAQAVEPPVRPAEPSVQVPPSDGRRTRFIRGEAVRLGADLPSAGFGAGAEGVVTWVILGPPVSYLVEFQSGGGSSAPTKVEEGYLSPAG